MVIFKMIRVILLFSLICITTVCVCFYQNPSVAKSFYFQKFVNPRSWGKIEIVDDKPIGGFKDIFRSEVIGQVIEQLVGFAVGVLICVLIGWKVSSYRNFYEKAFENSLAECLQKQQRFEKQLNSLELRFIDFERTYLFMQKEPVLGYDSSNEATNFAKDLNQTRTEVDETNKEINLDENEGLIHRAVEVMIKQNCDESQFECILEKLTWIFEKLSKLSNENRIQSVEREKASVIEDTEVEGKFEDCYEKTSLEVERKGEQIVEEVEEIEGNQSEAHPEEIVNENREYLIGSQNSLHELHACKSEEKINDMMISTTGAGECEETYRGKIVPVSQIPKYQELRKSQKLRALCQKEHDDEKLIPYVSCSTTTEPSVTEIQSPQTTPRKNHSTPLENSKSRGGRKKLRS